MVMFRESSLPHLAALARRPQSRPMTKRDFLLLALAAPLGVAAAGCRNECCHHDHAGAAPAPARGPAPGPASAAAGEPDRAASVARIDPDTPVDPRFAGCAMSCSAGLFVDKSAAKVQPGAAVGDLAHCPVSGVVFHVTGASPRRELDGAGALFFCCESCAQYFSQHKDDVLAKRGIGASAT
jgi:hypothetical protein